jgi:hypothetical protein
MFSGAAGMGMAAFGAGPLYTNAVMGHAPSSQQRDYARKASSTILGEDSIKVELHDDLHASFGEQESRPDSLHYARTDQPPYVKDADDTMMTRRACFIFLRGMPATTWHTSSKRQVRMRPADGLGRSRIIPDVARPLRRMF